MTDLFEDTKVNVYVVFSPYLNAYTYAGAPESSKLATSGTIDLLPLPGTIKNTIKGFYILGEQAETVTKNAGKNMMQLSRGRNNKLASNIKESTCIITDKFLEVLSKDEVKAVLLHEIGHSGMVGRTLLSNMASFLSAAPLGGMIYLMLQKFMPPFVSEYLGNALGNKESTDTAPIKALEENHPIINRTFITIVIVLLIVYMGIKWMQRKIEYKADSFAVKAGYGKPLKSALEKFENYIEKSAFKKRSPAEFIFNLFTKACHMLGKVFARLGFSTHPLIKDRIKAIDNQQS